MFTAAFPVPDNRYLDLCDSRTVPPSDAGRESLTRCPTYR
jgi:hypothetical protein